MNYCIVVSISAYYILLLYVHDKFIEHYPTSSVGKENFVCEPCSQEFKSYMLHVFPW